jgi:hypothetical protein
MNVFILSRHGSCEKPGLDEHRGAPPAGPGADRPVARQARAVCRRAGAGQTCYRRAGCQGGGLRRGPHRRSREPGRACLSQQRRGATPVPSPFRSSARGREATVAKLAAAPDEAVRAAPWRGMTADAGVAQGGGGCPELPHYAALSERVSRPGPPARFHVIIRFIPAEQRACCIPSGSRHRPRQPCRS